MTPRDILLAHSAQAFGFVGEVVKINLKINLADGPVVVTVSQDESDSHSPLFCSTVDIARVRDVSLEELPFGQEADR